MSSADRCPSTSRYILLCFRPQGTKLRLSRRRSRTASFVRHEDATKCVPPTRGTMAPGASAFRYAHVAKTENVRFVRFGAETHAPSLLCWSEQAQPAKSFALFTHGVAFRAERRQDCAWDGGRGGGDADARSGNRCLTGAQMPGGGRCPFKAQGAAEARGPSRGASARPGADARQEPQVPSRGRECPTGEQMHGRNRRCRAGRTEECF